MSSSLEKRQVIDYFIVAGLPDERKPLQDLPQKATHMKWPIIDVTVINKSQGELPPEGFECLEFTPNGHPANLNHGSVMAAELFLCFRRGWKKPPIIDLGVMYAGKDQPKYGCEVLLQTPYGRSANVNNTGGEKIYITYVRADETADCDSLAVVDICIILPGKNEGPPHAFRKIEKNLNRGMLGSDIFLCYKKSILKNNSLNFEAGVLFRYPCEDLPGCPFPQQVAMFCLPLGATIESWPVGSRHPLPLFSTFVLTGATGEKLYGAAVIFYDDYDQTKVRREELTKLGIMVSQSPPEKRLSIHQNQSICVLSRWPFFDTFRKFLFCLYRISVSGPQMVPLERHIGHFMSEVPFPSRERPRILVQLSTESVTLLLPEETPLPKSGASFVKMLMNLGPDNIISLVFYVLMEHRILIHSLRPDLLTSVAEAVVSMIFPFRWQCPYIPLCPLQLAGVLDSPTPFIIGLDSRYFDMFDPPSDITFVDLDTCTITVSEERKSQNPNILPKRPVKVLRSALEELYEQFLTVSSHPATPDELDRHGASGIHDLRGRKSLETFELSIQEAFLCFMVSLLAGYDKFLLTVTEAPTDVATTTDLKSLFSIEGFLNSREKSQRNFFRQMMKTQYFSRFIDERCFVSDENIGLAFFDECIRKLEEEKSDSTHLLDFDETSCLSETTVFVLPPEPSPSTSGIMFSCKGFSQLEADLFVLNSKKQVVAEEGSTNIITAGSVLRRTKQEVKSFQKTITQFADQAEPMAKCFVWICYSLWFMCLPSHILNISSKIKLLEEALEVLRHMHQLQMKPLDEVCYRILMHLCCNYKHPALAVKIYHEMQVNQIHPNAITYGFYNKAVLESDWSSPSVAVGTRMWKKLRNVLIATVTLWKLYRERMLRMHQNRSENKDGLNSGYIVSNVNTEFAEKESVRIKVADQKVCDAAASVTVSAELLVKSSDCERDCNWKQIVSDPEEREDLTDNITPKSGNHSALTPVTENDPLGLFATKGRDRNYTAASNTSTKQLRPEGMSGKGLNSSFGSDILKNVSTEPELVTSKSKSCDELNTDMFTAPSSKPLRRLKHRGGSIEARDNSAPVVSEVWQDHAKTLSQIGQVKLEDGSKSMHRTGSFGNALHSAANLFTLTYQNLRDSWSAGFSVQPATDRAGGSSRSSSGFLMPLQQSAQRTCSADNLSVELGKTTLTTKQLNNSLTGDNYGANAGFNDRTDSRGGAFEGFGSGMNRHNNGSAASVEAELCTQSKCTNCSNLLYDEEVMAGWTSNDSNLKTRCLCCGYNFVPMIHVNLKQFHVNKEPNSVTATDKNQECAALENKGDSPPDTESSSVIISDNVQLKRISPPASPICLDDRDGNSISHRPYYRILRNLLTSESVDEVKVGLTFDDDFPQMPSSSLSSIDSGTEEDTNRSLCKEESFSVPYLSPLVLKKEMENLLELDGEDCLKKFQLINDHPIVYWNLVWFFRRLHLPSHLYSFISKSSVFNSNDPLAKEGTVTGRDDVVLVRTLWDGIHTHKEYGLPMYILWRENSKQMISENDEVMIFSKSVLQSILSCVVNHDIQLAIEKVLSERKRIRRKGKILYRSIYYDVLFLSLSVLQNDFSLKEYDVLYREACNDLSPVYSARLMEADRPPRMATICCRQLFGLLEL